MNIHSDCSTNLRRALPRARMRSSEIGTCIPVSETRSYFGNNPRPASFIKPAVYTHNGIGTSPAMPTLTGELDTGAAEVAGYAGGNDRSFHTS